ncbi:hypothetical protein SAMN04488020_10781 [Palleronia marisminoris]|uniref:SnoaL-like domain-containing protein n=1 Tax=Palleronia marisminoris TaxID=315423 RepID=A0A1Y5T7B9_9RHOB|nr:hypothetical protein [Palleronia marisminoris]SFH14239.1 hypothetical protein SAMN04488020_10781 [Palleronia marisminoris]SLN54177.1 hypothetical protein PAM7066_02554 [Palleronia marisminoris]
MPEIDFQSWIDARSKSFFDYDFDKHLTLVHLPFAIATRTAVFVVEDEDKLRVGFNAWSDMLKSQRATDMICTARKVDPIGDDMIAGTFDTEILRGAVRVCNPYRSTATLRKVDGTWKAISIANGLMNSTWPFVLPNVDRDSGGQELIWTGDTDPTGENDG